ncbi:odorant receptor 43b-like [Scaptodrosophila lebanonensis]|uniref:Odorant receptor 43b-like n=1 Tax=Drosophila lebanonensis TaxID=7225 RepID=A0A6J2UD26_DROLE|nr:odorant receptor 43b-like [Scaptodrosophila lebanonensis]
MCLLKARVKRLGEINVDLDWWSNSNVTHAELVKCIKAHKIILHLYDVLQPVISRIIFIQFIMCGSILGIATINIVVFADSSTRLAILGYMLAVVMQSFPLCYYCNCLIDDCNDLADTLFHSSWYQQDQRYKKTVVLFLQKLQQPLTFTAMNIFEINLATNINVWPVAKFAFTIYALAQGMNLNEKLQKI